MNYKLSFYVPESHVEAVKQAVFDAGAGRQGDYEHCAWQCLGQGQFRPMDGAQPYIGKTSELSTVTEYKVEVLCDEHCLSDALAAMKAAHPYEEPAFDVVRLEDFS